jgi:glycosyltransferase involved in cell wall biosynthesis
MYSNSLDYAEKIEADILFFDNLLNVPEYLLAELEVRPNFKPKIVFLFAYRESYKAKSRAKVLSKLVHMPQVKFGLIESALGKEIIPPKNANIYGLGTEKCKFIFDRINEDPKEFKENKRTARIMYQLPQDKFILLFFGRLTFSKGIDVLAKAMEKLGDEVLLFITARSSFLDFDFDPHAVFDKMPNVKFTDGLVENNQLGFVYSACDAAVIPYRWTYTYGTSGIPFQAAMAERPFISPDIYPIDAFTKKFNLGPTFIRENVDSLVEAIRYTKNNYSNIIKNARFEDFLKDTTSLSQLAEIIIE